jgi:hypothetical protein
MDSSRWNQIEKLYHALLGESSALVFMLKPGLGRRSRETALWEAYAVQSAPVATAQ